MRSVSADTSLSNVPKVGVGVLVWKDGSHVLVGIRKNGHGSGEYALPGGHLEFKESFEMCASRELLEETGLCIDPSSFTLARTVNCIWESQHYVTIFMQAVAPADQDPDLKEPDKCEGWQWVDYKTGIPDPVFLPLKLLLESSYLPPP